ncbi:MAG: hypothetical protein JO307_14490 [Bryobacterales bacterium]|nr:hypothetical protein [Bryobacterales bacterium]
MAFTPETFSILLNASLKWFEMLNRLSKRREVSPQGVEVEAITIMLRDRTRQLRN